MAKILLVEENDANRTALARRLQRVGHEVLTAADGQRAVALAGDAAPDVILMDLDLPVLDGWAATRRIKASAHTRSIPVIALGDQAADRPKALEGGCDEYEIKPVELARLLDKIEALIRPPASAPSPPAFPRPSTPRLSPPATPVDVPPAAAPEAPVPAAPGPMPDPLSGADLPAMPGSPEAPSVAGVPNVARPAHTNPSHRRILVVDDTDANRLMLERRLRRHGFEVDVAADGETALRLLEGRAFDAVLLDVMMPGMNGVEVLRVLRRTHPATDLPVIMATARDASDDVVEALEAGANDYVTKPLDFPVVLARLHTHLSLKRSVEQIRELERGLEERNHRLRAANEKLRADLDAAAKVQASLLPARQPTTPGYQFRWLFRPSSALGGDILNVFRLDDRHVGLYVLDVSGHGVAAALLSVTVSHLLSPLPDPSSLLWQFVQRAHGAKADSAGRLESPARVAQRLAQRFPFDPATLQFFTLVYGVLDLHTHELTYVSAGHPNLIHHPRGRSPRPLEAAGFPIGLGDEDYAESVVRIAPGDRLIAYSDGILEALNPSIEAFGQQRVLEALEAARDQPIDIALHVLSSRVQQWAAENDRRDDQSVLAVERAASDGATT